VSYAAAVAANNPASAYHHHGQHPSSTSNFYNAHHGHPASANQINGSYGSANNASTPNGLTSTSPDLANVNYPYANSFLNAVHHLQHGSLLQQQQQTSPPDNNNPNLNPNGEYETKY
jgi:hypothetical protein